MNSTNIGIIKHSITIYCRQTQINIAPESSKNIQARQSQAKINITSSRNEIRSIMIIKSVWMAVVKIVENII